MDELPIVGEAKNISDIIKNPSAKTVVAAVVGILPGGKKMSKVPKSKKTEKVGDFSKKTKVVPGRGPEQSRAEIVTVRNKDGKTIRTHKDLYDRSGKFQHRKPLRGGPEGRKQDDD